MLPALWSGDSIVIAAAKPADLDAGDIAVYARNGHLVAHRVVRGAGVRSVVLVTRGDAQRDEDPAVDASELLGVVRTVGRYGVDRPIDARQSVLARSVASIIRRFPIARSIADRLVSLLTACRTEKRPASPA